MNNVFLLLCIGIALFIFQSVFFVTTIKWLSKGKRNRDKDFALLDTERIKLLDMLSAMKTEMMESKKISSDTLNKLKIIGMEAHAEWDEVTKRIDSVLLEVTKESELLLEKNIAQLTGQRLSLEKTIQSAQATQEKLDSTVRKAQKLLKLFDKDVPVEEIFKEIQQDKYTEAKHLLSKGQNASEISKKLGISLNEVIMISSMVS